jgi:carbamoyl-phosphate synthase large subunit
MKSVGEVMGIGRSFQEACIKRLNLEIKRNGLELTEIHNYEQIIEKLTFASWDRVFVIYDAIALGIPLSRIHDITKIDMWFLKQYEEPLYPRKRDLYL